MPCAAQPAALGSQLREGKSTFCVFFLLKKLIGSTKETEEEEEEEPQVGFFWKARQEICPVHIPALPQQSGFCTMSRGETVGGELHKTRPSRVPSNMMKDHKVQGCRLLRPQNRARLISGSSEDSWNKAVRPNLIYTLLYNVFFSPLPPSALPSPAPSFPFNVIVLDFGPPATRLRPLSLQSPLPRCCQFLGEKCSRRRS